MNSTQDIDLRRFSRVPFHALAQLLVMGRTVDVQLLDLSLKGGLVSTQDVEGLRLQEACRLVLTLAADGESISMNGVIAHLDDRHIGIECREIDIGNMTRLRRLLELNTGDASLVDRELSHLVRRRRQ